MTPSSKSRLTTAPETLVPERFSYIFAQVPVLWCENESAYHRLLADFLGELAPKTLLEHHWVKNIVDVQWEINRCQRLKSAALVSEMPNAARAYLGYDFDKQARTVGLEGGGDHLVRVMRLANKGNDWSKEKVEKFIDSVGVSYDILLYKSYVASGGAIDDLGGRILKLEQRRDDLIRRLEDRRRSLYAHQKSLVREIEEGSIIEVDKAPGNGGRD